MSENPSGVSKRTGLPTASVSTSRAASSVWPENAAQAESVPQSSGRVVRARRIAESRNVKVPA